MWRTLYHIIGGMLLPVAGLFLPKIVMVVFLGILTLFFLIMELVRLRVPVVNQWVFKFYRPLARTEEKTRLTGTGYLLIASFISFLVFSREVAVLALSFLAVGDAVAALVGRKWGIVLLRGKTLEGDLTCLVSCIIVGSLYYLAGLNLPLSVILVGAAVAAVVESASLPINDNLTMPLLSGAVMTLMAYFY